MERRLKQRIDRRLRKLERAARLRLLAHGLVSWLALAGVVVLVWLLALGWLDAPRWARIGLVASGGVLIAAAAWAAIGGPWRILRSRSTLVRYCDRAGGFCDTLAAAEEAVRRPDRWRTDTPARKVLVERLLARGSRTLDGLFLPALMPVWRPGAVFLLLIAVLGAGVWLNRTSPEVVQRGWHTLQRPWHERDTRAAGSLRLAPGPRHVVAGQDLQIAAVDLFGGSDAVICEVRSGTGLWQRLPAVPAWTPGGDLALGAPYQRWEATLSRVTEDLVYRFRRGQRVSEQRAVTVRHPPLMLELAGRVRPPAYTGLPAQDLPQMPAYLEVPQGSRVALSGRASNALAQAAMVTDDGGSLALSVLGDLLRGEWTVAGPLRLRPVLLDQDGLTGRSELVYEIAVLPDRLPAARLQRVSGADDRLPLSASLELQAFAEDDYGLIAADLQLRRGAHGPPARRSGSRDGWTQPPQADTADENHGWHDVPLLDESGVPRAGRRVVQTLLGPLPLTVVPRPSAPATLQMTLSLEPESLSLVPGDVVELRLVARDNRQPGPPGLGKSTILRLRVPSSLEVVRAGQESQAGHSGDLADMRRRSSSLGSELERLRRELLRNPVPEWDRRQLMQATVQRQMDLQDELARLAETMRLDLETLGEQRLLGPELMDRMDRIADLLSQHRADGLEELLERMRESLAGMSPRELAAAMEELHKNQADLLRRMDAAQAMLRELAQLQQMDGLSELAAELIRKQQDLADRQRMIEGAEEPGHEPGPGQELARLQEALARDLAALEERMHEALSELQEGAESAGEAEPGAATEAMREALSEALQQLQERQTGQTMQEASESLANLSEDALHQMQQALSDLAGLYHVLLRSQFAMQMAMQMEKGQQMHDLAADLLALSARQEQLGLDLPTSLRDVRRDDLVRRQHVILQGAISLHARLQEVASAAPREVMLMMDRLDELIESTGRTMSQLQEGRTQAARQGSRASLAGMNRLVIQLLTQAQITGQGSGSSCSRPQLGRQLQQMAEEQSGLNALAEQLARKEGRLSQELRAGMQRLQQEQSQLAGRAQQLAQEEQLNQQQRDGGRLLGDLGQVARDMEAVSDELAGGLVTEETLRRQARILSRLLDMHNASRERDWARRRESRTAVETYADQQGDPHLPQQAVMLEARRWRSVEQAPPAYRELVRQYLLAIQLLHEQTGRGPDGRQARERELP